VRKAARILIGLTLVAVVSVIDLLAPICTSAQKLVS
jgi:hypothetical protein